MASGGLEYQRWDKQGLAIGQDTPNGGPWQSCSKPPALWRSIAQPACPSCVPLPSVVGSPPPILPPLVAGTAVRQGLAGRRAKLSKTNIQCTPCTMYWEAQVRKPIGRFRGWLKAKPTLNTSSMQGKVNQNARAIVIDIAPRQR
jgi:hypothetical protein